MRYWICLAAMAVAMVFSVEARADTETGAAAHPVPTLDDFLSETEFWNPELSPSGRFLAGIRSEDGEDFIVTLDLNTEGDAPTFQGLGDLYVKWIDWVSDDRMLVSLLGYMDLRNGKQMTREQLRDYDDDSRAVPMPFSRLVSIDRQSHQVAAMFGDDRRMTRNFSLGRVTDFLPDDPDHILMPARLYGDLDLFKVNVVDGSFERIAAGTDSTYAWFTDRSGEPAFRLDVNSRGTVIYLYAREDKENGTIKWRKTRTIRLKDREQSKAASDFQVLYPGPSESTYYISARPDGADRAGIYLYDFEKDEILEPVYTNDDVDIEDGLFNPDTRELRGVFYYKDRLVIEMKDPSIQAHLNGLNTYFGNEANVIPMDSSRDGKRWLVEAVGPREPGSYHIYDLDTASAVEIGVSQGRLLGKTFGETQIINYVARDGLALTGYLTRPADAAPDSRPPLIVMPHGGPEMRDYFDYDRDVQILVAQGYQVFQPNFRGSSGYGKIFADRGRREWGRAMQTDLDDGFDYLVGAGLADAGRACIFGFSYGGYAALAAATLTPDKYQCIIDGAGPSDLVAMMRWERKEEGYDSESYKYLVEHVGDPQRDKNALEAVSPAKLADRVTRPILILHGEDDGIVPYDQSARMEKALKKAGKDFKLVKLKDSGHRYMSDEDEQTYYTEILAFLREHLPVV